MCRWERFAVPRAVRAPFGRAVCNTTHIPPLQYVQIVHCQANCLRREVPDLEQRYESLHRASNSPRGREVASLHLEQLDDPAEEVNSNKLGDSIDPRVHATDAIRSSQSDVHRR